MVNLFGRRPKAYVSVSLNCMEEKMPRECCSIRVRLHFLPIVAPTPLISVWTRKKATTTKNEANKNRLWKSKQPRVACIAPRPRSAPLRWHSAATASRLAAVTNTKIHIPFNCKTSWNPFSRRLALPKIFRLPTRLLVVFPVSRTDGVWPNSGEADDTTMIA